MRSCPQDVWSGQQFERWRREAERGNPKLLFLTREQLMRHAAEEITEQRFPEALEVGGVRLRADLQASSPAMRSTA